MRLSKIMISTGIKENKNEINSLMKRKKTQEEQIKKMETELDKLRADYKKTLESIINIYGSK